MRQSSPSSSKEPTEIEKRKHEHLEIAASQEASFHKKTTLLEQVQFIHQALPEHHLDQIDLSVSFLGKSLKAPLVISGMTGGTDQARRINLDLAKAAETLGIGFGLGSQRPMVVYPHLASTYQVREVANTALLFANLGLMQAKELSSQALRSLCQDVGADAICLHLNPAMELIQSGGDRDFRGGIDTIKRVKEELGLPVIIKETGCGLSREVGEILVGLGINTVDVSGAGGTSWVGVETLRGNDAEKALGEELWDWGIPTAASIAWMSELGLDVIATGGLRKGTDVAAALGLGARLGGLAAPVLRAHHQGGYEAVISFLKQVILAIQAITFLTGCQHVGELRFAKKVLGAPLRALLEVP